MVNARVANGAHIFFRRRLCKLFRPLPALFRAPSVSLNIIAARELTVARILAPRSTLAIFVEHQCITPSSNSIKLLEKRIRDHF
jgi:hypothetical protein